MKLKPRRKQGKKTADLAKAYDSCMEECKKELLHCSPFDGVACVMMGFTALRDFPLVSLLFLREQPSILYASW